MPAALSIWLKTQPLKMWPFALMCQAPASAVGLGSRRISFMGYLSKLSWLEANLEPIHLRILISV